MKTLKNKERIKIMQTKNYYYTKLS